MTHSIGIWGAQQPYVCPFCDGSGELGEYEGRIALTHSLPPCARYLELDAEQFLEAVLESEAVARASDWRRFIERQYDETSRIISGACCDWLAARPGAVLVFYRPRGIRPQTATPRILEQLAGSPETLELLTHLQERAGGLATVLQIVTLMECLEQRLALLGRMRRMN